MEALFAFAILFVLIVIWVNLISKFPNIGDKICDYILLIGYILGKIAVILLFALFPIMLIFSMIFNK